MSVYIAAPRELVALARIWRDRFEREGVHVHSGWVDRYKDGEPDPVCPRQAARLLAQNVNELWSASVLVVLTNTGGRETYVEIGRALAWRKPVVWYAPDGIGACLSLSVSALVQRADSFEEAYSFTRSLLKLRGVA